MTVAARPIDAVWPGRPTPRGAQWDGLGVNFALFSEHAERVELCLFDASGRHEVQRIVLPESADDRVLTAEGKLDYAAIRPLARVGYHDYTSFSETFSMPIPGAEGAAAAGLEGRA